MGLLGTSPQEKDPVSKPDYSRRPYTFLSLGQAALRQKYDINYNRIDNRIDALGFSSGEFALMIDILRLRIFPAVFISAFVGLHFCAIQADAQEAIQSDSSIVGSVSLDAMPRSSRLRGLYWNSGIMNSNFPDLNSPLAVVSEPASNPLLLTNFPIAAHSPAPVLRGCGLVSINPGSGPVPSNGENPIFSESKRLLDDPRFGLLDEPQRQKYLGEWKGLHHWQGNLLNEAKEIAADWKKVEVAVNGLDTLGCRVKREIDSIEPDIKTWAATCSGSLDQATLVWCNNERERLLPLVKHRDEMIEEFKAAVETYNNDSYYPTLEKSAKWGEKVGLWEDKIEDFNTRLTAALSNHRKADVKFIDYLVRKYKLDNCQREYLHDLITRQHWDEESIEREARDIGERGEYRCPPRRGGN